MDELIDKAKKGDKEAFASILKDIQNDLYKIAKTRFSNEEDILDAIQETSISAYLSIKRLKKNENFKKWIIKILINKCNDIWRLKKDDISLDENVNIDKQVNKDFFEDVKFEDIISFLTYEEKIILTLFYSENYTSKEIAKLFKMNENTVRTKISRAKNKIMKNFNVEE